MDSTPTPSVSNLCIHKLDEIWSLIWRNPESYYQSLEYSPVNELRQKILANFRKLVCTTGQVTHLQSMIHRVVVRMELHYCSQVTNYQATKEVLSVLKITNLLTMDRTFGLLDIYELKVLGSSVSIRVSIVPRRWSLSACLIRLRQMKSVACTSHPSSKKNNRGKIRRGTKYTSSHS